MNTISNHRPHQKQPRTWLSGEGLEFFNTKSEQGRGTWAGAHADVNFRNNLGKWWNLKKLAKRREDSEKGTD